MIKKSVKTSSCLFLFSQGDFDFNLLPSEECLETFYKLRTVWKVVNTEAIKFLEYSVGL